MRATICVDRNHQDEVEAVEAWFARWRGCLTFVSENEGCGCCVDIWNVEGPDEAMAAIPGQARGGGDRAERK